MPIVRIPDKNMVVRFPDDMSDEEIEREIYSGIYGEDVISEAPEPSLYQRLKERLTPQEPTIGRPLTEEDRVAFEPADITPPTPPEDILQERLERPAPPVEPTREPESMMDLPGGGVMPEEREEIIPGPAAPTSNLEIMGQMVKDSLFGELPAGAGAVGDALDYWGKYRMTVEEEMKMAKKHPNLMAARYAAASILLPGVSQYFASTVDWEEFQKQPIELQRLDILGTTASYVIFGVAARWIPEALVALFPGLTKPVMKALKESTWFRRLTIKERGIAARTVNDMKSQGLSEHQILKALKKRSYTEFKKYRKKFAEETGRVWKEEKPPAEPEVPPGKPVKPKPEPPEAPPEIIPEKPKIPPRIEPKPKEVGKPTTEELAAKLAKAMEPPKKVREVVKGIPDFTKLAEVNKTDVTSEAYRWAKDATKEQYEALKKVKEEVGKQIDVNLKEAATMPKGPKRAAKVTEIDFMENSFRGEALEAYEGIHNLKDVGIKKPRIEKALGIKLPEVKPTVKEPPKAEVYESEPGKFVRVAPGPSANWTFYKVKNLKERGQRVKTRVLNKFYKTKEEAQAALDDYAGTKRWRTVDISEIPIAAPKKPRQPEMAERPPATLKERVQGLWQDFNEAEKATYRQTEQLPERFKKWDLEEGELAELKRIAKAEVVPKDVKKPITQRMGFDVLVGLQPTPKPKFDWDTPRAVQFKSAEANKTADKFVELGIVEKAKDGYYISEENVNKRQAAIDAIRTQIKESQKATTTPVDWGKVENAIKPAEPTPEVKAAEPTKRPPSKPLPDLRRPGKKPTKLTILKDKKKILAEIDAAIAKAPAEPETETKSFKIYDKYTEKLKTVQRQVPKETITFEIDGGAHIFDSKAALQEFRQRIQKTKEGEKVVVPTVKRPIIPKPVAGKKEEIGDLYPVKQKGWFTDGHILIKGEPPKGKIVPKAAKGVGGDISQLGMEYEKTRPAELQYYYIHDPNVGRAVSKDPMARLGTGEYPNKILFKVDDNYASYVQEKFNLIRNRFPNAEYRINKNSGMLVAYQSGKPVAGVMPLRAVEPEVKGFPGLHTEPALKEEAIEAGFLKKPKVEEELKAPTEEEIIEIQEGKRAAPQEASGRSFKSAGSYADFGGYATLKHQIIEMPEIVEMTKALLKGKYPSVVRKLGQALGKFYAKGIGDIKLRADIFKDADQAAAIIAHELGHLVDYLPDYIISRGNVLGRIATLKKYFKHTLDRVPGQQWVLTAKDRVRLRRLAEQLVKKETAGKMIDEMIRKELPITPDDVIRIWNSMDDVKAFHPELYDYIARLSTVEKKAIVKEALKNQVPAQLQRFAKVVMEKTGKKIPLEPTKGAITQKYHDLINAEVKKHQAFTLNGIKNELMDLTRQWKPFDPAANIKYTRYRFSSPELYADAFSALLNAPGLVRSTAPEFYRAFFNYMDTKPQVKKLYQGIQDSIKSGEIEKIRTKGVVEMFRKGDDAYALSLEKEPIRDLIARELIDQEWFILKKLWKIGERNVPAGENPRYKLEQLRYTGAETEWYSVHTFREVIQPLEKAGLTPEDMGFYMFLKRVAGERAEMANPKGWTPRLAKQKIAAMPEELGERQTKALLEAYGKFQEVRKYVMDKGKEANVWSPELLKLMAETEDYATFDVIKYIEKRHGAGPSAKIFHQIGTLNEISNPLTATIMKDINIIKNVNRKIAAKSTTDFLRKHYPDEITPAETKWNGKFHEIRDPRPGSKQGLIVYSEAGKAEGWYVPKRIAEAFEHNPIESMAIAKILSVTARPFKMAFTELNYGFWLFNAFFRDYQRAAKMLPKNSLIKFLPHFIKGMKPAFKSVFGITDTTIDAMLKNNMLISIEDVHGLRPEDSQIDRFLQRMHLTPKIWNSRILKPFGTMFNWFTNIGRGLERTTKIASYEYIRKAFPDMPIETVRHIVLTRGGSPDFLRLGRAYAIYNNLLLFSNAAKEGYRGDYEAFADSPAEFMWKQAKYTYLPKLLMYAASIGLLGAGIKKIYDGVTEYDAANYIIIPLGTTPNGKSVYFRVPTDETSRFMGGILWKILQHDKKTALTGLFDYMAGQAPTLHPLIDVSQAIVQYASGLNPYDHFRGRYAIPEQIFQAGGERSHKAFLKWLAGKSGMSLVYKFSYDDVDSIKTELEKVLGYPVLSNIVGRFIKVTDYGKKEKIREFKLEIRTEKVRALLDAKDAINKWIRGEPLSTKEIGYILAKPDSLDRNMMVGLSRKYGSVYLSEYLSAQSNAEKAAVINKMLELEK